MDSEVKIWIQRSRFRLGGQNPHLKAGILTWRWESGFRIRSSALRWSKYKFRTRHLYLEVASIIWEWKYASEGLNVASRNLDFDLYFLIFDVSLKI